VRTSALRHVVFLFIPLFGLPGSALRAQQVRRAIPERIAPGTVSPVSELPTLSPCYWTRSCPAPVPDGVLLVDGRARTTLASAIEDCPQSCWIMDLYPETFYADPFARIGNKTVRVTLGRGTWVTRTTITIPTKSQLEGSGRGDPGFSGTVIQAATGFPWDSPVVELGNALPSMGVRLENLTIDCNGVKGCTGIRNTRSQEQSGIRHILVENITGIGLDVYGSAAQNSGPYEDLELYGGENVNVTSDSLCARIVEVPAFRGIHGATCNFNNYAVHPKVGIEMDSSGTLTDIHIEGAENGIALGVRSPASGAILQNIYGGGPNIRNLVHVYRGENILLMGLARQTTPVSLVDELSGQTFVDSEVAFYAIGNGAGSHQPRLTSSSDNLAHSRVSNLAVTGTLTKGAGAFKIDHPLDPEHKFLQHSFVESPDMMNIYNGVVVLDAHGEAEVQLPDYFEALNRDFQYQLTPLGSYAPIYIAREIKGNQFRIAGGAPGMKVSWQVTGIRHDAYADANRIQVESPKSPDERGTGRAREETPQ
jgi:hypothetical protein